MDVMEYMSGPCVATLLFALLIVLLFRYLTRKHKYWKERGLPYAKAVPIFGSVLETFSKPLNQIEEERYKKYGKIYGHYEGSNPVISVGDPAVLRNIIIKDFHAFSGRRRLDCGDSVMDSMLSNLNGEDWKRVRTIITPAFTTGKMKKMLSIFKDCAKTCRENFLKYAKEGKSVEVKVIYGTFTMDVIASSAFSTKIDSHNDPNNKFVSAAKHVFVRNFSWRVGLYIMFPRISRLFQIGIIPPKAMKFFKKVTLDIVQERKRTGQTRNDFLQLLLDTAKEVGDHEKTEIPEKEDITANYGKEGLNHALFSNISKKALSHDELVAQCIIFFLAGYDTTASTLSFASYLLALNPDIQEKLISEIDKALLESNGELTYDVLQSLKYLDNVISETFRIYSPAARLERVADESYDLKDVGITIPKGMIVTVPICALQKDPEYFPDPEKFDPDRFSPEERATRDPFTYMPFGAGPRNCIGMRFALLEMKMCLAVLLSQFRIKRCPETKVPLEFFPGQQPMQPKDLKLEMEVRKDAVAVQ